MLLFSVVLVALFFSQRSVCVWVGLDTSLIPPPLFPVFQVLGRQAQSLNVYQMAGTFLIGFIFMVVGVLLHLKDLFWPDHNKVMPADQEFLDESVRRRTEWEAAAGSKFKSVSPGASPGPTLREARLEREGSEAFSAANTLAQAPSQGDHSVRPALAESDLGERGKDGVVVVNAGESHEAGWVVGPRADSSPEQLEEAGKAVAQRGAELEMITQVRAACERRLLSAMLPVLR